MRNTTLSPNDPPEGLNNHPSYVCLLPSELGKVREIIFFRLEICEVRGVANAA